MSISTTMLRALTAGFLLTASPLLHATSNGIFRSNFEGSEAPPSIGIWSFNNVTGQSLDQTPQSEFRFDVVWNDFNGDGCYDAFLFDHANVEGPSSTSRLWVNRCDGSNTFVYTDNAQVHHHIPAPTLPRGSGWITLLDVNGDGRQDFWLRDANTLAAAYINGTAFGAHQPVFIDKVAGCDDHCSFGDIDGDDQLDVVREDRRILRISDRHQIDPAAGIPGRRVIADITGNGWPDLVQPAAGGYWKNDQGELTWRDANLSGGTTMDQSLLADFDNDGRLDLLTIDGSAAADGGIVRLYRNNGNSGFNQVYASGLEGATILAYWTNYGNVVAADFDNDGLQDVLIAGSARDPSVTLYRNLGGMQFERVNVGLGEAGGIYSDSYKSRAAVADYDNDGRLDILKTQAGTNIGIWRNTIASSNNYWMKVRVRGAGANTDGIGTDLTWTLPDSSQIIAHMQVQANDQHAQTWVQTGLGSHQTFDLTVHYPHGGPSYTYQGLAPNQEVIVFPNGCMLLDWHPGDGWPLTPLTGCSN